MPDVLHELQSRIRDFAREREWQQFHDPKNLAMAVVSEAGELVAEYRWIPSSEADAWSQDPEHKERIAAEIGDVAITLLLLCDRIGVDLPQAVVKKLEANALRYPVEESKGKHSRPGST